MSATNWTAAQSKFINFTISDIGRFLVVFAYAGSGKTRSILEFCRRNQHTTRFLWMGFNTAPIQEQKQDMSLNLSSSSSSSSSSMCDENNSCCSSNVEGNNPGGSPNVLHPIDIFTFHAFAIRYVKDYILPNMEMITSESEWKAYLVRTIRLRSDWREVRSVPLPDEHDVLFWNVCLSSFSRFCHSDDPRPDFKHLPRKFLIRPDKNAKEEEYERYSTLQRKIVRPCLQWMRIIWQWTQDGSLAFTFDSVLKFLSMSNHAAATRMTDHYDVCVIDEAQDLFPAIFVILDRQQWKIVLVGDPWQQLYGWMGSRNNMNLVVQYEGAQCLVLDMSFRMGHNWCRQLVRLFEQASCPLPAPYIGQPHTTHTFSHRTVHLRLPYLSTKWTHHDLEWLDPNSWQQFSSSSDKKTKLERWAREWKPSTDNQKHSSSSSPESDCEDGWVQAILARSNKTIFHIFMGYVTLLVYWVRQFQKPLPYELVPCDSSREYIRTCLHLSMLTPEQREQRKQMLEWMPDPELAYKMYLVECGGLAAQYLWKAALDLLEIKKTTPSSLPKIFLSTVHSCKGLEWEATYVCDDLDLTHDEFPQSPLVLQTAFVDRLSLPSSSSSPTLKLDLDKLRLIYVALTRQSRRLYLPPRLYLWDKMNRLC